MPKLTFIDYSQLSLDLRNYRTIPQKTEKAAIKAMIKMKSERFYALMESILDDGYLLTSNVIVQSEGGKFVVKEGNRRVASLKLIHGDYKLSEFGLPKNIVEKIESLTLDWKKENTKIPCTVYNEKEYNQAKKVVDLTHGKSEQAGRDPWNSVAHARHNRESNGSKTEYGLDLLEKFIKETTSISQDTKELWVADYPITILNEVISKIYESLGFSKQSELSTKYPKIKNKSGVDAIIKDIGIGVLTYKNIRSEEDWGSVYGFHSKSKSKTDKSEGEKAATTATETAEKESNEVQKNSKPRGKAAKSHNDPTSVKAKLRKFTPLGEKREKVATLKRELLLINIANNPIGFCFLMRSILEISCKAYCDDHKIIRCDKKGFDLKLTDIITSSYNHLTENGTKIPLKKKLHAAYAELNTPNRVFSVDSLNQLIHNDFPITLGDACTLFHKMFPLLEELNYA